MARKKMLPEKDRKKLARLSSKAIESGKTKWRKSKPIYEGKPSKRLGRNRSVREQLALERDRLRTLQERRLEFPGPAIVRKSRKGIAAEIKKQFRALIEAEKNARLAGVNLKKFTPQPAKRFRKLKLAPERKLKPLASDITVRLTPAKQRGPNAHAIVFERKIEHNPEQDTGPRMRSQVVAFYNTVEEELKERRISPIAFSGFMTYNVMERRDKHGKPKFDVDRVIWRTSWKPGPGDSRRNWPITKCIHKVRDDLGGKVASVGENTNAIFQGEMMRASLMLIKVVSIGIVCRIAREVRS